MKLNSYCYLFAFVLIFCNTSSQGIIGENEIKKLIQYEITHNKIPGIAACVISEDSIKWKYAYGYSDVENKKLFKTNTVINIASVSKTILGLAIMIGVDNGLIDLDLDINQYLKRFHVYNPNLSDESSKITLRNLATHTSGIVDRHEIYLRSYVNTNSSEDQLSDFLHNYFSTEGVNYSKKNFSSHKPGSHYQYTNIGAALASEVLSQGTDISFIEFCKEYIFKPLEMKDTYWFLSDVRSDMHSNLYDSNMNKIPLYDLITFPDGGLRTSIDDLSKLLLMVMNDGNYKNTIIISSYANSEMIKPQFNDILIPDNIDGKFFNHGIFWHVENNDKIGKLIGHTGGDRGITSYMYFSPSYKSGVILIVNKSLSRNDNVLINKIISRLWQFALN